MNKNYSITDRVKEWYMEKFSTDPLGQYLNAEATFKDVEIGMKNGFDFYEIVNASDSIIRERIFSKLAELYGTTYNYWYDLWLSN